VPLQLQSNMALAYIAAGDHSKADELLELILNAAEACDRDRVRALTNLGISQRLQGRYQEPQRSLQQAWTLASETGQGNFHSISEELSRLALLVGDTDEAAAWLDRVADTPADPVLWASRQLVRAKVALAGQRGDQARALLEQMQANPDVPTSL